MNETTKITPEEQVRISDLAREIAKKTGDTKTYEELCNRIALFVEGVKLGLNSKPSSDIKTLN